MAGLPTMLAGIVSAPLLPGPTCCSPTRVFSVDARPGTRRRGWWRRSRSRPGRTGRPCASFAAVRAASPRRRSSRFTICSAIVRPKAISDGEVVLAVRPAVAELQLQAGEVGERPLDAERRAASRRRRRARVRRLGPAPRRRRRRASSTSGRTTAPPKVGAIATFLPRRSYVPRSRSQPSMRGSEYGSRLSKPLVTSYQRHTSRTERAMQPEDHGHRVDERLGPRGMRPAVPFMPTRPLKPAGMRIEPPPSPPVAIVTRPPATAAAEPPDEPPAVRPCCHGLWRDAVEPVDADVEAAELAGVRQADRLTPPASSSRSIIVLVRSPSGPRRPSEPRCRASPRRARAP